MPSPTQTNSLLIVAGEVSGDQCGGDLLQTLHAHLPRLHAYGIGGDHMRAAGMETLFDIQTLSAVGITEVGVKLLQGWRMIRHLRREARRRQTQIAVLIDAPVFNLPLARRLKSAGLHVIYYISPQIWAWRQGRVKKIARCVDKMLTLFPFETSFYKAAGVDAEYVGHPIVERLRQCPSSQQAISALALVPNRPTVALLPGSRRHEVKRHLPLMLQAFAHIQRQVPQVQAVLPVAATVSQRQVQRLVKPLARDVKIVQGQSTTALCASDFAIVASGTATLEAGFIGTPMVVVYKAHPITAWLAKRLIQIPCIGLVNIVAGRRLVPELLQAQARPQHIAAHAVETLQDPEVARRIRASLRTVRCVLGTGDSTQRAASCIRQYIERMTPPPSPVPSPETR